MKKVYVCVEYFYTGGNGGEKTGFRPEFETLEEALAFQEENETITRDDQNVGTGTEYVILEEEGE